MGITNVTRLGNLLDFGQVQLIVAKGFEAFGNN